MTVREIAINQLKEYPNNPRHNESAVSAVAESIRQFGFKSPIVIDSDNVIIAGHTRLLAAQALGLAKVPCIVADDLTPEQVKAFRLADNKTAELAEWDFDKLEAELLELEEAGFDMGDFGFDELSEDFDDEEEQKPERRSLNERFIVPPFSILDARQGYWRDRKKLWREKILDDGSARGGVQIVSNNFEEGYNKSFQTFADASLLDPVLCEIIMKWFYPKDGETAFDCFAGDTVFGFVSASCGATFTGIELRQEQVEFNQSQVNRANIEAKYICDDGRNVAEHIGAETQDLFFSCPPYFDLEVYSDKPNDASNQGTYEEFYKILDEAFTNAVKCLKNNRFAVVVVGDVRNRKTGEYYGFMDDVKQTFKRNGLKLYNELILVDTVGTAAVRAARMMQTRKVCKTHQNVLVFYKGDTNKIKDHFAPIEYQEGDFADESENE